MDPQQGKLLEVTYEALENAGIPMEKISGSAVSCFVGNMGRGKRPFTSNNRRVSVMN